MEYSSVSVEDFQEYHNQPAIGDVAASPPFATVEDDPASFSDSAHGQSSGAEDEAVFDPPVSTTSSPRTSHASSDEEISILESAHSLSRNVSGAPFTPTKSRSPFHQPSSVRAMQLDTTPPHLTTPSSQRKRLYTPSRQSSTPRSARSGHRNTPSKLMNSSPIKTIKKEHPLVLLHITLLAHPQQYSLDILEEVLPPTVFATWKLLLERMTTTVLHRGVLIPHPREDYDILEERLLESLELKQPRILKCGHFHLSAEEEADIEASEDEDLDAEDLNDEDICDDCGKRIRDGRYGNSGAGNKRWDVKVFAANGLMRAGAWSAAWREMERVDVEILPWMEESVRRALEIRSEEQIRIQREEELLRKEEGVGGLDDERLREIYGQDISFRGTPAKVRIQDEFDGLMDSTSPSSAQEEGTSTTKLPRSPSQSPFKIDPSPSRQRGNEIPLWDLFRNCLYLSAQDPRNLAIWALSALVLFLSLRSFSQPSSQISTPLPETSSQIIPPVIPTVAANVVNAVTNGGAAVMNSAAAAIAAGTMTKTGTTAVPTPLESDFEPLAQLGQENAEGERAGERESSWSEVAGEIVSGFVEEEPSLPEG